MRVTPACLLSLILVLPLAAAQSEGSGTKPKKPRLKPAEGTLPIEWVDGLRWRSIGPANMGGRVTDIAVHPTDSSRYWIGTAGAGVLRTTNNGVSYDHLFSQEGTSSIGALAVAPSNPEVIYVGTGEPNPRNSVSWGDGVYRSSDAGETWQHLGLAESFQIGAIVVHPEDENIAYVAALGRLWGPNEQRGLYKTSNGGEDWERILFVDEHTGVVDVTLNPADPDVILAATYERERDAFDSNDPAKKWGPGSGLWRSQDGGKNFERLSGSEGPGAGLPDVTLGRIGIDWAPSNPGTVFAIVETERITQAKPDSAYIGVISANADVGVLVNRVTEDSPAEEAGLKAGDLLLRLADRTVVDRNDFIEQIRRGVRGETVKVEVVRDGELLTLDLTYAAPPEDEEDPTDELGYPRAGPFSIGLGGQRANQQDLQGPDGKNNGGVFRSDDSGTTWTRINSLNPRPMYYSQIRVDPSDVERVYVLGTRLYRSEDGGQTFTADGHDGRVHVDHHALWIDPRNGRHMILGNDGGIYVTWDRMANWDHHNHVAIGQFYNVGIDATRDYRVFGGLQDNGSWGGPNRTPAGGPINSDWFRVGGGDGFVVLVDPTDRDLIYYESQNGGMGRWHLGTGDRGRMRPRAPRGETNRWNWNTPFILSSRNPKIYYSAGSHVFRSIDRGENPRMISPKLSHSERGTAVALAESPRDERRLYVGFDDGSLWTTPDGGVTWVDLWTLNDGIHEKDQPEPRANTVARPLADSLSGMWDAKAAGPGIDDDSEGAFTLDLALGAEGKVSGRIDSPVGSGELREGRFDAGSNRLTMAFVGPSVRLDITATLDAEGQLSGTLSGAGGAFQFTFSALRREGAEPQASGEEAANESGKPAKEPKRKKALANTIDSLLPGRRYVSDIVPSVHNPKHVFVTFDGHRSNDDAPYVFLSTDAGETWEDLGKQLPKHAGSARALAEDPQNEDLLVLGTEFGCYVSIDRGATWTRLNGSQLPTVPVHDFALHDEAGELVAATHGRSLWILELGPLRQLNTEVLEADAHLFLPPVATRWRTAPTPGSNGTRSFRGSNPSTGSVVHYSLTKQARNLSLTIQSQSGEVLRTLDASSDKGLHRVVWDQRAAPTEQAGARPQRRRARRVEPGTYMVVLEAHGQTLTQPLVIVAEQ